MRFEESEQSWSILSYCNHIAKNNLLKPLKQGNRDQRKATPRSLSLNYSQTCVIQWSVVKEPHTSPFICIWCGSHLSPTRTDYKRTSPREGTPIKAPDTALKEALTEGLLTPRLFQAPLLLTSAAEMKRNHNWVQSRKRWRERSSFTGELTLQHIPNALYTQSENIAHFYFF